MSPKKYLAPILLTATLGLGACGSSGGSDAAATTAPTTADAGTATTAADAGGSVAKVSANDASRSEIAAALTAAGVDNADRWAGEVVEYRPYDDSADGFPRLREELAKYNPADGVVDKIISVLSE